MPIRVAIIGIDAATFDVILPLVKRGCLPNLGSIMEKGAWGPLRSTYPPISVPAWVSCITGKGPGQHGLLDFRHYDNKSYSGGRGGLVNSSDFAGTTIFDILSRAGKRVGVFRVPITYPPWPVNGFMVSGQPTPDRRKAYTYPESLADEVGDLHREANLKQFQYFEDDVYLDNILWDTNRHFDAAIDLLRRKSGDIDLFMMVLNCIDAVQHRFWKFRDTDYPFFIPVKDQKYKEAVDDLYRKVDEGIGKVLESLPDDVMVLVVSDHGTRLRPYRTAQLNRWLMSKGFLKIKCETKPEVIDWSKTVACRFPMYPPVDGISINLKGRQPEGNVESGGEYESIRSEILSAVGDIKDPQTGCKIVQKAWRREELYHGSCVDRIPDIVVLLDPGYEAGSSLSGPPVTFKRPEDYKVWNGFHSMDGILIATGPGIRRNEDMKGANIVDVTPTVLYALGLPVMDDMDGRVLNGLFMDSYLTENPVVYTKSGEIASIQGKYILSEDEETQMKEKLRVLGYIE